MVQLWYLFTTLFKNTRILQSQLTCAFFAAVNHLSGPFRKHTKVHFSGFKRSWFVICDWWISIRYVCFFVSGFVGFDPNYD